MNSMLGYYVWGDDFFAEGSTSIHYNGRQGLRLPTSATLKCKALHVVQS
jgi:hypothetical protein